MFMKILFFNNANKFTVIFGQFNTSLLNKSINLLIQNVFEEKHWHVLFWNFAGSCKSRQIARGESR